MKGLLVFVAFGECAPGFAVVTEATLGDGDGINTVVSDEDTADLVGEALKWMQPEDLDSNPCSVLQLTQTNDLSSFYVPLSLCLPNETSEGALLIEALRGCHDVVTWKVTRTQEGKQIKIK